MELDVAKDTFGSMKMEKLKLLDDISMNDIQFGDKTIQQWKFSNSFLCELHITLGMKG